MPPGPIPRLLAVTPPEGAPCPSLVGRWRDAGLLDAGLAILLREPGRRPTRSELARGRLSALLAAAQGAAVPCLLGSGAGDTGMARDLCLRFGLAGVHLRGDPDEGIVARLKGNMPEHWVSRAVHARGAAAETAADFSLFAPVFTPRTRAPGDPEKQAVGLEALECFVGHSRHPVLALGGIDGGNAQQAIEAGAHGVAAISALFDETGTHWPALRDAVLGPALG